MARSQADLGVKGDVIATMSFGSPGDVLKGPGLSDIIDKNLVVRIARAYVPDPVGGPGIGLPLLPAQVVIEAFKWRPVGPKEMVLSPVP